MATIPSASEAPIRFGTSGWRGVLADDFTFARADAAVAAVAAWLRERGARGPVILGHDRRLLGERFVARAAARLAASGLQPISARGPVPTPVIAHAVRARRAAAGLVFTASHNPPEYHGLKVFGPWGGGIEAVDAARVETLAARALAAGSGAAATCEAAGEPPRARRSDFVEPYLAALGERIDARALRRAGLHVIYDALHGAGAGVLDRALAALGARVDVLRGSRDPGFGGRAPDPSPAQLEDLARAVRRTHGLRFGLATDGDADRIALVDEGGGLVSETDTVALLVDHLARTGRIRRGVAISVATGTLVEKVAASHGLPTVRLPIGFKHLSRALVDGVADVAGEESGGFAWEGFCRDKDGILAGCLLAELVATAGAPLRRVLAGLHRRFGASVCGRSAVPATLAVRETLAKLEHDPPLRFAGGRVQAFDASHGLRFALEDGFVMLRASGTESLVRIYAEAPDAARLARRLAAGAHALTGRRATRAASGSARAR